MATDKNTSRKNTGAASNHWLSKLESWLSGKEKLVFWSLFGLHFLLCLFSFDPRLTGSNDDANYIEQGFKYARDFTGYYYTFQAPLYPMFLALIISFAGVNLILLKLITLALELVSFWLLYRLFRRQVPATALFATLLVVAVNYYFLFYSTHTFSETFFMVLQSVFLICFSGLASHFMNAGQRVASKGFFSDLPWKWLVLAGVMATLLTIAKNAAVGVAGTYILYFALRKQWKALLFGAGAYGVFMVVWILMRTAIWGELSGYGSQGEIFKQKHPYDATKGYEDTKGFIRRFTDNTQVYMSNRLMEILNLKSDESDGEISKGKKSMRYHPLNENDTDENRMPFLVSAPVTFLVILLFLAGMFVAFRNKQEVLLASAIQTIVILGLTFLVVHVFWAQHRFLYIFIPIFLLLFFNMLWQIGYKVSGLSFLLPLFTVILFFSGLSLNDTMIKKQGRILASAYASKEGVPDPSGDYKLHFRLAKALFSGDKYSGITPDWANYLKMCEWVGKNIPDTCTIAVRKPGEAFIYAGGRNFRGIYQAIDNPDTALSMFKREHIRFVVLSQFRLNQEKNDGNIINTIHRVLQPIEQKYPGTLKLIHKEGESEDAQLYQINY